MTSVYDALAALDRLEVRGRDSVGLHLMVSDHGMELDDPALARAIGDRAGDPAFGSSSVRRIGDVLSFVYKQAAEIDLLIEGADPIEVEVGVMESRQRDSAGQLLRHARPRRGDPLGPALDRACAVDLQRVNRLLERAKPHEPGTDQPPRRRARAHKTRLP